MRHSAAQIGYARLSQEQHQSRKVMLRLGGIYRIAEYERL
jgi:hypothetical protein